VLVIHELINCNNGPFQCSFAIGPKLSFTAKE
jgi:hypothetical protein